LGFGPELNKCRGGAPEGERTDRKVRARLRTACGWPIARLTKGASQAPERLRKSGLPDLRTKHADLG